MTKALLSQGFCCSWGSPTPRVGGRPDPPRLRERCQSWFTMRSRARASPSGSRLVAEELDRVAPNCAGEPLGGAALHERREAALAGGRGGQELRLLCADDIAVAVVEQ